VNFATLPGLAVLNPGGRDPDPSFEKGPGLPSARHHPPINYHSYAACTKGAFYRSTQLAARHRSVLLLLSGGLTESHRAFQTLKSVGCFVAVCLKESGAQQVAKRLSNPKRFDLFQKIASQADLCLSSTPDLVPLYAAYGRQTVHLPTPYPLEFDSWNFSRPRNDRKGIFIGTREFSVLSRNHLLVLASARKFSVPITVINEDGKAGERALRALKYPLNQLNVSAPLPYPEYLRLMARHRLVLQFDHSFVPGQVAGDSLLCRIPTVGGNGAIERIAFPRLHGHGRSFEELLELVRRLLDDHDFYEQECAAFQADCQLSFSTAVQSMSGCLPHLA
jgi:hypothetical protein